MKGRGMISNLFDIQFAIADIFGDGDLTKAEIVNPEQRSWEFDTEDKDVLVQGDVLGDALIRCGKSVVVEGDIVGKDRQCCRFEAAGDIVINGDVSFAQIKARNIHVGGTVRNSQLFAEENIKIGGDLLAGELTIGNARAGQCRIEALQRELGDLRERFELLRRQVLDQEKQLFRECKAAGRDFDFSVGRFVRNKEESLCIDLSAFYQSVGSKEEKKIEPMLKEFFAKGIVGVLARRNHKRLAASLTLNNAFMRLLRKLKELFLLVTRRDRAGAQLENFEREIAGLLAELENQYLHLHVRGAVLLQSRLRFERLRLLRCEEERMEFNRDWAELSLEEGADGADSELTIEKSSGERFTQPLSPSELQSICICLKDEQITRQYLPAGTEDMVDLFLSREPEWR